MALLDLFFLFDLIEITNNLVRPHIRTLTDIEILSPFFTMYKGWVGGTAPLTQALDTNKNSYL